MDEPRKRYLVKMLNIPDNAEDDIYISEVHDFDERGEAEFLAWNLNGNRADYNLTYYIVVDTAEEPE